MTELDDANDQHIQTVCGLQYILEVFHASKERIHNNGNKALKV